MNDSNEVAVIEGEVTELVPVEEKSMRIETGWLNNAVNWEDFISLWMSSKEIENINQFFKGDIVDRVACKYGGGGVDKFAQEVKEPYTTVISYRRVSRAFKGDTRNLGLCWTHYFLASQTDEYNKATGEFSSSNRNEWVEKANDNGWSVNQLATEIKKAKALVSGSMYDYYDGWLNKVENVLLHLDKSQLDEEQKDRLIVRVRGIADSFESYFSDLEEVVKVSNTTYDTEEEARDAIKRRKQKTGSIFVRRTNEGRFELVTEDSISEEYTHDKPVEFL